MLGPASMDIGFAGRKAPAHLIHRAIAALKTGDAVEVRDRFILSTSGQIVGRLAAGVDDAALQRGTAYVVAMMVRTRSQTSEDYWPSLQVDHWETPLAEVVLGAGDDSPR